MSTLKRLCPYLLALFFISSLILAYLWQKDHTELQKALSYNKGNFLDTGPIDDTTEGRMTSSYATSQIKKCLNGKEGIYHKLKDVVSHFNAWITLGCEETDFSFTLDANGDLNIVMIPLEKATKNRVAYDSKKPETKALDLGDLHP